jgi:hypothetical protein
LEAVVDLELIGKIIQLYGFPAAMCIWFMLRLEKKLEELQKANHKTVVILAVLVRILGEKRVSGAIPEEFIDEVSGVTEIPVPKSIQEPSNAERIGT